MNDLIISNLKLLEKQAINRGEKFRAKAFRNAYLGILKLESDIKNVNQLKVIPGIGRGILNRISQILSSRKLEEVEDITSKDHIIEKFLEINGVGFKTAEKWYKKGYRNIDDIIKNEGPNLTLAQKIGIKYKDELIQRIPRERIDEIYLIIINVIKDINSEMNIDMFGQVAGSYRRGKKECGDIDCLISEKNSLLEERHIHAFLEKLRKIDLITDEISFGQSKFMGVCVDKFGIHRRIDFEFVYDYNSFVYELLYFTGSGETNVLMRREAKKLGMMLNQHGLYKKGKLINSKNEKEVFNNLKMEYLDPEDR